jgi:chromosome segregation ATPase
MKKFDLEKCIKAILILIFVIGIVFSIQNKDSVTAHNSNSQNLIKKYQEEIDDLKKSVNEKESDIDSLKKDALIYESNIKAKQKEAVTLENQLSIIENTIAKTLIDIKIKEKEIDQNNVNIAQINEEIKLAESEIEQYLHCFDQSLFLLFLYQLKFLLLYFL